MTDHDDLDPERPYWLDVGHIEARSATFRPFDVEPTPTATVHSFTFTAEPLPAVHQTRRRRLWLWIRRKPHPRPPQPPGTVPLLIDYTVGADGIRRRIYVPAARVEHTERDADA